MACSLKCLSGGGVCVGSLSSLQNGRAEWCWSIRHVRERVPSVGTGHLLAATAYFNYRIEYYLIFFLLFLSFLLRTLLTFTTFYIVLTCIISKWNDVKNNVCNNLFDLKECPWSFLPVLLHRYLPTTLWNGQLASSFWLTDSLDYSKVPVIGLFEINALSLSLSTS